MIEYDPRLRDPRYLEMDPRYIEYQFQQQQHQQQVRSDPLGDLFIENRPCFVQFGQPAFEICIPIPLIARIPAKFLLEPKNDDGEPTTGDL